MPEKSAEEIAVGFKGRLFITSDRPKDHTIFDSYAFKEDWELQREQCKKDSVKAKAEAAANDQI